MERVHPGTGVAVSLVQGDITAQAADAIVNAANRDLAPGGGVDGAIRRAGGPGITAQTVRIGGCPTGGACATGAGDLAARHVIHAVGPVWLGGGAGEPDLLASCHRAAVGLAGELGCRSVALPAISTGIFGFPVERAAPIAIAAASEAAGPAGVEEVRFVLWAREDLDAFAQALAMAW
ncbi:MAG: macro domain-containing protein [Thermoleophilia bacterium]|jgi:O-acetyl-ADP-ribose deacetylase (regulator of RNase III)|nr:macro domain-containing protein [Thermoleophilia bacterium]